MLAIACRTKERYSLTYKIVRSKQENNQYKESEYYSIKTVFHYIEILKGNYNSLYSSYMLKRGENSNSCEMVFRCTEIELTPNIDTVFGHTRLS